MATKAIPPPTGFSFRLTESPAYSQNKEEVPFEKKESKLMKDRYSEVMEDSANQTHPVPSPAVPGKKQTTLETTEDTRLTVKKNIPLLDIRQSTDHFGHVSTHLDVKIPFLCETTNDPP
ncbi:hypothetical protein JD844_018327, partial [Phrynosoma platyrhinos]